MRNEELFELIKERVQGGGTAELVVTGVSMEPLFKHNKTVVDLVRPEKIRKYDIVLYKRANGAVVLHRAVKVKGESLSCRGDGELITEKGIAKTTVAAVAVSARTDGKTVKLKGIKHRMYGRLRALRRTFYRLTGRGHSPRG